MTYGVTLTRYRDSQTIVITAQLLTITFQSRNLFLYDKTAVARSGLSVVRVMTVIKT